MNWIIPVYTVPAFVNMPKNQFQEVIASRIAAARAKEKVLKPVKVVSEEKLEAKARGFAAFQARKAFRKAVRGRKAVGAAP